MLTDQQLSDELETLRATLAATKRRRMPVEARMDWTNAYIALLFGIGHARLGNAERARACESSARGVLVPSDDEIHRWLVAACSARIDQALAGAPDHSQLPDEVAERYAALDRVARYKIDRLREASRLFDPGPDVDAIGTFSRRLRVEYRGGAAARLLGAFVDAAPVDEQIARLEELPDEQRAPVMIECLCAMSAFPENDAMPIVVRALPLLDRLPAPQLLARATALRVVARFGWGELVPPLVAPLVRELRDAPVGRPLQSAVSQGLRALRRLGCHAEMTELIAIARERAQDKDELAWILDGASSLVGDEPERLRRDPLEVTHPTERLELQRRLALAFAHGDTALAPARFHALAPAFVHVTDAFGTNSHFALSVLYFVDALVHAFTLLSITRG